MNAIQLTFTFFDLLNGIDFVYVFDGPSQNTSQVKHIHIFLFELF